MKKKRTTAAAAVVCIAVLIFTAALLIIRPDIRFYCEQLMKYSMGSFKLKEIEAEELELYTVDADSMKVGGSLMLVNKAHPLKSSYRPLLSEYKDSGVIMSAYSVDSYAALSEKVFKSTDCPLYVMSSYRDEQEQEEIHEEQGSSTAMPPACSEHRTGLAQDLYFSGFAGTAFNKCEAGRFVTEHAAEYGFILRYPPNEMRVTGIEYEPWHFRYVGQPHADIITQSGITLEEYIQGLEYEKFYEYDGCIISRQQGNELSIPKGRQIEISYDNCGGYIITAR